MRAVWLPAAKTARNLLRQNDVSRVIKSTRDGRSQPLRPRAVRKADKRIERTLRVQKSMPAGILIVQQGANSAIAAAGRRYLEMR